MFSTIEARIQPPARVSPPTGSQGMSAQDVSAMTLFDRVITLAKDAETGGFAVTADRLVRLAISIFDEAPRHTG